jgi:hypothetical protein
LVTRADNHRSVFPYNKTHSPTGSLCPAQYEACYLPDRRRILHSSSKKQKDEFVKVKDISSVEFDLAFKSRDVKDILTKETIDRLDLHTLETQHKFIEKLDSLCTLEDVRKLIPVPFPPGPVSVDQFGGDSGKTIYPIFKCNDFHLQFDDGNETCTVYRLGIWTPSIFLGCRVYKNGPRLVIRHNKSEYPFPIFLMTRNSHQHILEVRSKNLNVDDWLNGKATTNCKNCDFFMEQYDDTDKKKCDCSSEFYVAHIANYYIDDFQTTKKRKIK